VAPLTRGSRRAASPAPRGTPVSDERFARLTRGINVSHWFAQAEISVHRFKTWITAEDVRRIADLDFRHVRLPLDPLVLFNLAAPERLNTTYLSFFDAALDMILDEGLAVIIDLHPDDGFKRRLATNSEFAGVVARFWRALAAHLSRRDPEFVFLEAINEPQITDPFRWNTIQQQWLAAMREGAPKHTLIATGYRYSSIDDLQGVRPVLDPNVVYNFHFYEPHTFTHQGATWGAAHWRYLRDLPYPSSPGAVAAVLPSIDPRGRSVAEQYGRERWNGARIEERILQAVRWAQRRSVRLTCNEFGVYRQAAPVEGRLTWIHDVRAALETYGIGWAMWDYAGGFGLVVTRDGRRVVDEGTLHALGL
jgi:hypothetical protein